MKFSSPRKLIYILVYAFSFGIPFAVALKSIISGAIPFWYDPARDLLSALANLKDPTLIGPPTGIQGLFYGPYWIWILSFSLIISKDPRWIVFIVQTLPYFILFPLVLYKTLDRSKKFVFIFAWLLFILSFKNYTTFLWNPHLSPLLTLILIYLLCVYKTKNKKASYMKFFFAGITSGLIANLHMSFGIAIILTTLFFYPVLYLLRNSAKAIAASQFSQIIKFSLVSGLGVFLTFFPHLVFDLRNDFLQSKSLIKAIQGDVSTDLAGFSNREVFSYFINTASRLLQIPESWIFIGLAALALFLTFILKNFKKLKYYEKAQLVFIFLSSFFLLAVFLAAKNPVWHYHFISTEILFLTLFSILLSNSKIFKAIIGVWVAVLLLTSVIHFKNSFDDNPLEIPSLTAKKYTADLVFRNADSQEFSVFAYSPSIYTYDYDYLFTWLNSDRRNNNYLGSKSDSRLVYLIIPDTTKAILEDFINYKTPNHEYQTFGKWSLANGTQVIRREIISK